MAVHVYRAPMRSRRDDVDHPAAVRRALTRGLCGIGGRLDTPPPDLAAAIEAVAAAYDERSAARLERFAAVPDGDFVWARDDAGAFFLGRLAGPWHYDGDPAAEALDLVHVRPCRWLPDPVPLGEVPVGVLATFERGGRNFQQTHADGVVETTDAVWSSARP